MPNWTEQQRLAIDGRDGMLLVSAAAGSGKTAVLVERVIRRLTDTVNRCPANELVIVTFTRAAAAQMKEKIDAALSRKIAENPDRWLLSQQLLLQSAKICTIDSFCGDIVRENFHMLGISADYKTLDASESDRYSEKALSAVLGEMYASGNADFRSLVNLVSTGGSDKALGVTIKKIYESVSSYPFPDEAINLLEEPYLDVKPISQSIWGKYVLENAAIKLGYCVRLMEDAVDISKEDTALSAACEPLLLGETSMYRNLLNCVRDGDWDSVCEKAAEVSYKKFSTPKKIDEEIKSAVKQRRERAKKLMSDVGKLFCLTGEQYEEDMKALAPAVVSLLECVRKYKEKLFELKRTDNAFDFNDIEHLALELLVEKTQDGVKRTELAQSLSDTYREIMVDEYQDTNSLQDMIFSAVAKGDYGREENLFLVGDVKQSIYGFRQAMPELFLGRRAAMNEFDGKNYPGRINLSANFRSRKSVAAAVNFVFSHIMSEQVGEIDYDESEQLNAMAAFEPHSQTDVELCINEGSVGSEPEFVAGYIKKLLSSGRMIKDDEGEHAIRPGDICILTKVNKVMGKYVAQLEKLGIAAEYSVDGEIGGSTELRIVLSLLRVLDNPLQDIPLTALMLSPLFGFTHDDLALLRTGVSRGVPVYRSVVAAAKDGNTRCAEFLEKIDSIRRIEIGMGAAEFLRRMYDETGILSIAAALSEPEQRTANLWALLDLAGKFDSAGGCGLSAFLRFIDNAKTSKVEFGGENSDAVKVMTIHKSKGLEFGVCILANLTGSVINDDKSEVVFSKEQGIGLMLREPLSGKKLKTLPYISCRLHSKQKDYSEVMRVMYVALTRAKEMLTIVGSDTNPENRLADALLAYTRGARRVDAGYLMSAASRFMWLLPVFMRHADAHGLRAFPTYFTEGYVLPQDFRLSASIGTAYKQESEDTAESVESTSDLTIPDTQLARLIKERTEYVYPYSLLNRAASKKQASGFLDESFDETFFASSRPAFMNSGGLTAAQKGTLTHRFMQLCDLANDDVEGQLKSMVESGRFTESEAGELNTDEISAFFSSDFRQRILASPNVMREKKFAMLMPVTEVYADLPDSYSDETIVVQGMLDLMFEEDGGAVIVDYKTDRGVGDMELIERHYEQLKIYARAVEHCTDCKVRAAYVYSLPLKKEIKVL